MRKLLLFILALSLLALPVRAEDLDVPEEETTFQLEGPEDEAEPQEETYVSDQVVDDWDEDDYYIPYPDVTSREIRNLLKPSDRVYPGKLVWPLPGTEVLEHITSHVGWRNAARIHSHQGGTWPSWLHHGIDVGHVTTRQSVVAAAGGLAYSGERSGYGKYVVIDHQNGWYTEYQHLSRFAGSITKNCRKVRVQAGDILGYVGNSGGDYPVHFHFEIAWSPKGQGSTGKQYLRQLKNRTIRAYSFPQSSIVELHWARTWEICTAEKQNFVATVEELSD